ncbi:MAG: DegT/DnrJ/EryC1/StrS family aminotransferase [Spirochaetia bacterium]|nr:DegT/DnrJ/EryC1/StrS family aminotransferase [Spirochaetia bacterium]
MYRIGKEELDAVQRVFDSNYLFRINSPLKEADQFEKEWAELIGSRYCLAVSGGTNALISALVGMQIGPGDEVIIPAYTFMATAIAVLAVGAIPVIADIDQSLTIDCRDIRKKITEHTACIIPVHINGFPCDMQQILEIAEEYHLQVLEDACQADGGSYRDRRLGSLGDAGAFSFNHFKILSAGEGGAVVTDDRTIFERALIYHDGGTAFRPYAAELSVPVFTGNQHRISEITGAILRVQQSRLEGILSDLRARKQQLIASVDLTAIDSHDIQGDCGTTAGFIFDSPAQADAFCGAAEGLFWLPINSDKHVFKNWSPLYERLGGQNDFYNPYKMEANRDLRLEFQTEDYCTSLDLMSRVACISINPDWTEEELDAIIGRCEAAGRAI